MPGLDRALDGPLQGRAKTAAAGRRRGGLGRGARAVRGRDLRGVDGAERRHRNVSMMRVSMPRVTSRTETLAL